MGTGICMCRVDVAQAVKQIWLDPGSRTAWNGGYGALFERINEENVRVRQVSSGTDTGFLHGSSFVARKLVGGVCFHARPDLGVRQCKICQGHRPD